MLPWRALVGIAFALAAPAAWADKPKPGIERWSLPRFEAVALERNRALDEARAEVRLNQARRMEAAWARFPRFEWTSVAAPIPNLRGNVLETTTPTNRFVGFGGVFQQHKLEMVLPIVTFGKLGNAKRAAEAGVDAAQHGVERARAEVLRDVRRAYYAVKVSRETMTVIQEGWERITAAEKRLEELLEKGAKEVEELDKNRLATFAAEVASRRQEAVTFADLSEYALRVAAGLPQTAAVTADTEPLRMVTVSIPPLDGLIAKAVASRPEVKALDALVRVRRSVVGVNRASYYPDLFLAATAGVARCNVCTDQTNPFVYDPFNIDLYGAALGIRLTLDYPQKIARVRQAEAELRKLEAQRERALEGIRLQVRQSYLEWRQAKEQAAAVTRGRKAAQGWLFQSTISFNTGLLRLKDLTDALGAWFKFRLEELRSIYNYNVAVSVLSQVIGEELPVIAR